MDSCNPDDIELVFDRLSWSDDDEVLEFVQRKSHPRVVVITRYSTDRISRGDVITMFGNLCEADTAMIVLRDCVLRDGFKLCGGTMFFSYADYLDLICSEP